MKPPARHERPRCAACNKVLRPDIRKEYRRKDTAGGFGLEVIGSTWTGRYHGYSGKFCTKTCGLIFAVIAYERGFRLIQPINKRTGI